MKILPLVFLRHGFTMICGDFHTTALFVVLLDHHDLIQPRNLGLFSMFVLSLDMYNFVQNDSITLFDQLAMALRAT